MEKLMNYIVQFRNEEVIMEFVEETQGVFKFQTTKYNYDLELEEKAVFTFTVELSPLKDDEREQMEIYNLFYG